MKAKDIPETTLGRLPDYLTYLRALPEDAPPYIASSAIAQRLHLGEIQVRKDLAMVSSGGRPKVGYSVTALENDLEEVLGYRRRHDAVIVGCGKLGMALLDYTGFGEYGLSIAAGFDVNENIAGETPAGRQIFPMTKLDDLCRRLSIDLGILAVPAVMAQAACDSMVHAGIRAILNFAPAHLEHPESVVVKNENIAVSLAQLSYRLDDEKGKEGKEGYGEETAQR